MLSLLDQVFLKPLIITENSLAQASLVIFMGPREKFTKTEFDVMTDYVNNGGAVSCTVKPTNKPILLKFCLQYKNIVILVLYNTSRLVLQIEFISFGLSNKTPPACHNLTLTICSSPQPGLVTPWPTVVLKVKGMLTNYHIKQLNRSLAQIPHIICSSTQYMAYKTYNNSIRFNSI